MANMQKPIKAVLDSNADDSYKTQKPIVIQLDEIPAPEAGDAGKALVVNESEDGFELATVGGGGSDDKLIIFTIDEESGNFSCNKTLADVVTDGALNGIYKAVLITNYDILWISAITYDDRHAQLKCDVILPNGENIFRYILKSDGSVEEITGTTNLTVEWDN